MDKETLSNYGWIVICVLVLAVMIALATPFGSFVSQAVQSTTQGLFDTNKQALDIAGIVMPEQKFEELNTDSDNTNVLPDGEGEQEVQEGVEYFKVKTLDTLTRLENSDYRYNITTYEAGNYYALNPVTGEKHKIMVNLYTIDRGDISCLFIDKRAEGYPISSMMPAQSFVNWSDGRRTVVDWFITTNQFGTQTAALRYNYFDANGELSDQSDTINIWYLDGDTFKLATGEYVFADGMVVFKDGSNAITNAALGN